MHARDASKRVRDPMDINERTILRTNYDENVPHFIPVRTASNGIKHLGRCRTYPSSKGGGVNRFTIFGWIGGSNCVCTSSAPFPCSFHNSIQPLSLSDPTMTPYGDRRKRMPNEKTLVGRWVD